MAKCNQLTSLPFKGLSPSLRTGKVWRLHENNTAKTTCQLCRRSKTVVEDLQSSASRCSIDCAHSCNRPVLTSAVGDAAAADAADGDLIDLLCDDEDDTEDRASGDKSE